LSGVSFLSRAETRIPRQPKGQETMLTILAVIGITILLLPFFLWLDERSITQEDFQSVEDWHNFRKALRDK
jgi:hypothetical protein